MRIYITLNENKEKDKLILDYLNKSYDYKSAIKILLYQNALKEINEVQIGTSTNVKEEVLEVQRGVNEVRSEPSKETIDDDILNFFK